jgi:integrase
VHKKQLIVAPADAALLPPELAASAAAAVQDILTEAASANTTRSYASALRYWAGWHQARFGAPIALPVSEAAVVQFIVDHLARKSKSEMTWELPPAVDASLVAAGIKGKTGALKLGTVVNRVAVLSSLHTLKKLLNPCEQPAVRHLLSRARRAAAKRGERPSKKTAATLTELDAMLATCDDTLEGVRDRALLCFGFASGGRRRSEIAGAQLADLTRIDAETYVYRLEHSKTQQAGPTAMSTPDKPLLGPAAVALADWLRAAGVKDGAIFRRLWGNTIGEALSPAAVGAIVRRRATLAGLDGNFAGHSLRSGFVTEGGRQGVALPALMAMTGHRSVASVIGYFQTGGIADNPAAQLLKKTHPKTSADT